MAEMTCKPRVATERIHSAMTEILLEKGKALLGILTLFRSSKMTKKEKPAQGGQSLFKKL